MDLCEFEASLVYRVSSSIVRTTYGDSVSKNKLNKFLLDIKASHFLLLYKSCRFCGTPFPKASNHRLHSTIGLEHVPSGVCSLPSACLETCGLRCSTAEFLAQGQHGGALPCLPSYVPSFPPCNPQGLHMSKHRGSSSPGLATRPCLGHPLHPKAWLSFSVQSAPKVL